MTDASPVVRSLWWMNDYNSEKSDTDFSRAVVSCVLDDLFKKFLSHYVGISN